MAAKVAAVDPFLQRPHEPVDVLEPERLVRAPRRFRKERTGQLRVRFLESGLHPDEDVVQDLLFPGHDTTRMPAAEIFS